MCLTPEVSKYVNLWRPQRFRTAAEAAGRDPATVAHALETAERLHAVSPGLPPVLSLRHLAELTGTEYFQLRSIVRRDEPDPYRLFRIRKRPSQEGERRFRVIAVPSPALMRAQRWIAQAILAHAPPHRASVAFSKGSNLVEAAAVHCGCRWLVKLDVRNFFESISEISAYRVFVSLGYQPLVSFELARLCTRLGADTPAKRRERWQVDHARTSIEAYQVFRHSGGPPVGHLPQGAPTSPMLANLAMRAFDAELDAAVVPLGLRYTRYADDLTLSARDDLGRDGASRAIGIAYGTMGRYGLSPNATKAVVATPGSRKVVLGLLVDGAEPRLPREFKDNLRRHLHYLARADVGPMAHARARGFASTIGMRNHLFGLLAFAKQIEPDYAAECRRALDDVAWPL